MSGGKMRTVTFLIGALQKPYPVQIPIRASGDVVKREAIRQGVPIQLDNQLLGHNRNGTSSVVGYADDAWHDTFEVMDIYDSA